MKLYVVTHKEYKSKVKKSNIYQDILVGAALGNNGPEHCINDNEGENISAKNQSFCELTALYWIWKNSDERVVGLEHYRRYLVKNGSHEVLDQKTITDDLKQNDIILPQPLIYGGKIKVGKTAAQWFGDCHDPLIWTLSRDIMNKSCPEYVPDLDWFSYQLVGYCFNMFISNKEIIDEYCEWLFPILFELEKEVDISRYDSYNKRMFGFLSERLFNVWLHHNKLTIKEYPFYMTEKPNILKRAGNKLKSFGKSLK